MTFPAKSNNKAQSEGSARIMAATLTLVAREQRTMPPPYSLWNPRLDPGEIKEMALEVAGGKAHAVWVDDSHPARGLLIIRERELESEILGYGSAMLKGPYLVDPDPVMRGGATSLLVRKGSELAGSLGARFLSAKTTQDPAVVRGFLAEGFLLAEIGSCLKGPVSEEKDLQPLPKMSGLQIVPADTLKAEAIMAELGELFYDGHHLHGPLLPEGFAKDLWRRVLIRDIKAGKPALILSDLRGKRAAGLALADIQGPDATLSAISVGEEHRGRGLGKALLKNMMRLLHRKGARTLSAETASYNIPALSLYLSSGLRPASPKVALHRMLG